MTASRPRFEASTELLLGLLHDEGLRPPITPELLASRNSATVRDELAAELSYQLRLSDITVEDRQISGPVGELTVAVARPAVPRRGPLVVSFHGGGLVKGNRYSDLVLAGRILAAHGGVAVSPEYRLAPEHPAPAGFDDAYATYLWAAEHAEELGADPTQILLVGISAGGNLAIATALAARDRSGPRAVGVLAACPMLDDRNDSVSTQQFWSLGSWTGSDNEVAWSAVLGDRRGGPEVSAYEAPARAQWLGGLPPVFLDVSATEPFRDEVVAFASGLWRDGGDAELHVYPGGTHVHELYAAGTWIGRGVLHARAEWVAHLIEPDDPRDSVEYVRELGKYPIGEA